MPLPETTLKMTLQSRPEVDLAQLLGSVAQGRREALAQLYDDVHGRVFAFAMNRLGDRQAASDVLHEVMLAVWRQASSFHGRSRPLTWILGIAHHKIVDLQRRLGRWRSEPPDEGVADERSATPFDRAAHSERRVAVRGALEKLSDAHRQVVHLAFFEDLSYAEIARILGIPEGTVKTRMFHAKKNLQRRLEGEHAGGSS